MTRGHAERIRPWPKRHDIAAEPERSSGPGELLEWFVDGAGQEDEEPEPQTDEWVDAPIDDRDHEHIPEWVPELGEELHERFPARAPSLDPLDKLEFVCFVNHQQQISEMISWPGVGLRVAVRGMCFS